MNLEHPDTYTVHLNRNEQDKNFPLEISVYDDDHDLQAFFEGDDEKSLEVAVNAFHAVEPLSPEFSNAPKNTDGIRNFSLTNNPDQTAIRLAIETAVAAIESRGYVVTGRFDGWK